MSYEKRHCRIHGNYSSIGGEGCSQCRLDRVSREETTQRKSVRQHRNDQRRRDISQWRESQIIEEERVRRDRESFYAGNKERRAESGNQQCSEAVAMVASQDSQETVKILSETETADSENSMEDYLQKHYTPAQLARDKRESERATREQQVTLDSESAERPHQQRNAEALGASNATFWDAFFGGLGGALVAAMVAGLMWWGFCRDTGYQFTWPNTTLGWGVVIFIEVIGALVGATYS